MRRERQLNQTDPIRAINGIPTYYLESPMDFLSGRAENLAVQGEDE